MSNTKDEQHIFIDPPLFKSKTIDLINNLLNDIYCEYQVIDKNLASFIERLSAEVLVVQRGPFVLNYQFTELKSITEHFMRSSSEHQSNRCNELMQTIALLFDDLACERELSDEIKVPMFMHSNELAELAKSLAAKIDCPSCLKRFPKIRTVEITKDCFRCPKCDQLIIL